MNNLRAGLLDEAVSLRFCDDKLSFFDVAVDSYFASVAADFIRHKLLESGVLFTFETVMSSADKVSFLRRAQQHGFRTSCCATACRCRSRRGRCTRACT